MDAIEELRKRLQQIKAPLGGEKVYKDECAFSFDNPVSTTMNTVKNINVFNSGKETPS